MIRGIDTQIMIARTTDVARDSAVIGKFGDVAQDNTAMKAKLDAMREEQTVQKEEETDRADLRPDEDGNLGAEYEASEHQQRQQAEEDIYEGDGMPAVGTYVPRSINLIDITV